MGIYHKNTLNITKIADIYLKQTNEITRICKVYICTAANTFQLVYDGCAACNCDTFCNTNCSTNCYCPCMYHTSGLTSGSDTKTTVDSSGNCLPFPDETCVITYSYICGCGSSYVPNENDILNGVYPNSSNCTSTSCAGTCNFPGCFYTTTWDSCSEGFDDSGTKNCREQGFEDCPTLGIFDGTGPGSGIYPEREVTGIGPNGETITIRVTYICYSSCCDVPNGGFSACDSHALIPLKDGDYCCNFRADAKIGGSGFTCLPSGDLGDCCNTAFECPTP